MARVGAVAAPRALALLVVVMLLTMAGSAEAATSRLARELAAMEETDEPRAQEKILEILREAAAIHAK